MFNSNRWVQTIALAVLLLVIGRGEAVAQAGGGGRAPMTPVAYRQGIMQELQTNMGALNAVRAGEVGSSSHTSARATILQSLASMLGDAFADASVTGQTRALPAIWSSPADFSERVQALRTATDALLEATRGGDQAAIASAQTAVQQACAGCHMQFRGPAQ